MVKARYQQRPFGERVPAARTLDHVLSQDVEGERELMPELVLPLLDEAPGRDDEATLDVAADHQLLAEEPGHDRLASAGIVSQEEPQGLARQHFLVDRFDLVRQWVKIRRLHREERIKQVSKRYPLCLRHEPEEVPVGIHRPGSPGLLDNEPRLVLAVEQLLVSPAGQLVREREGCRTGAVPDQVDDPYDATPENTSNKCALG